MKAGFQKWYIAIIIRNLYCFVNHQSRRFVTLVKGSLCFLASLDIIIPREDNLFLCLSFISPWKRFVSWTKILKRLFCFIIFSLRSRRLEIGGGRENERARRETRASPSRALVFSCANYFQAPVTQATLFYLLYIFLSNCSYTDPDHSCSKRVSMG